MFQREHVTAFQTAAQNGIPRVVHAGFFGTANSVVGALLVLKADRISHGYHIIDDEEVYKMMIQLKVLKTQSRALYYCTYIAYIVMDIM